ncbi:transposase [Acidiphilium multivorum]|nr:transposase [Acidiphilium multivorum]
MTWTEIAWIFRMKEGRDGRNHKPEEIIDKLREPEIALAEGGTVVDACRRIGITEPSYDRWRKEYGGLKMGQARRTRHADILFGSWSLLSFGIRHEG